MGGSGDPGSSVQEGTYFHADDYLPSPSGQFQLIMQSDGGSYAMSKREEQEGDSMQSNTLDITQAEPGSYQYNTSGVRVCVNTDGEPADHWGIDAAFYGSRNYGPTISTP